MSTAVESPVVVSVLVVSPAVVCSVVGSVSVGTGSVVLVSHAVMAAIINMANNNFFITYEILFNNKWFRCYPFG